MLPYIGRRLLATVPVMTVVAVVVFMLLRLTTGDPAAIIAGDNATSADVEAIRSRLGLDQPLAQQFVIWIGNVLRGDLGESFFFKKQVSQLIVERVEPTLALATCTLILAVTLAVPLGVLAAWRRGTWIDRGVMGLSVLGFSVPVFVIGYLLIYLVAIQLAWLPVQGYQRLADGFGGFLERLVLPSLTLAIILVALIARITRASVLEVLNADHVRTARAKGLGDAAVLVRHVLSTTRNADGSQTERTHWMGTDSLGRDVYSRVVYGARVSLVVGLTVALLSTVVGLVIGVVAGSSAGWTAS
jgi:peptide/nickel transport system permease protein